MDVSTLLHDTPLGLAGLLVAAHKGFIPYVFLVAHDHSEDVQDAARAYRLARDYSEELRTMSPNSLYTPDRIALIGDAQLERMRSEFWNLCTDEILVSDFRNHRAQYAANRRDDAHALALASKWRNLYASMLYSPTSRNREACNKFIKILYKARRTSRKRGDLANVRDINSKLEVYTQIARDVLAIVKIAVGNVQGASATYDPAGKSKREYNLVVNNAQGTSARKRSDKAKVRIGYKAKRPLSDDYPQWDALKQATVEKHGSPILSYPLRIASASTKRN